LSADGDITAFSVQAQCFSESRVQFSLSSPALENVVIPPRIAWSKRGNFLSAGSTDQVLRVWDLEVDSFLHELSNRKHGGITCVDFHPEEDIILSGSIDGTVSFRKLVHF
jgi:WD40 repeat protein